MRKIILVGMIALTGLTASEFKCEVAHGVSVLASDEMVKVQSKKSIAITIASMREELKQCFNYYSLSDRIKIGTTIVSLTKIQKGI